MVKATISHWGADIYTDLDWLLQEPALEMLNPHLADAFVEIEKLDLRVKEAHISSDPDTHQLQILVLPEKTNDPRSHQAIVQCCHECMMPITQGKLHPDNGCSYWVIDHVMST